MGDFRFYIPHKNPNINLIIILNFILILILIFSFFQNTSIFLIFTKFLRILYATKKSHNFRNGGGV
ncbi:hypothetical protein CCY99_01890 [Helicobacter sp. 16-1353]|nr:hypothetical protein CCY99_01890 [Helicobacter sp. 16-1353]